MSYAATLHIQHRHRQQNQHTKSERNLRPTPILNEQHITQQLRNKMGAIVSTLAFPVPPKEIGGPQLLTRGNQLLFLQTKKSGLRLPAIHIKYPSARYTILFSHGNAEDVGISLPLLDQMARLCGASVFAYEYPGYSVSEGEPSEEHCYHAIDAAFDHLTKEAHVPPSSIVVFGRSLGTGPSVDLCSRLSKEQDVAGCILQSPLESGIRCFLGSFAAYALYPIDIFRSYQKVEKITCPVFIMHGEKDTVVPCHNGKALYEILKQRPGHNDVAYEPMWIPSAGHNDMPHTECFNACRKFILSLR